MPIAGFSGLPRHPPANQARMMRERGPIGEADRMESLPDVVALLRAVLRQDAEGMASIFAEYGFTDAKSGGFVGKLCGLFIGLADGVPDHSADDLLTRLYESALSES